MLELKEYQDRTLGALRGYFRECIGAGADTAFYTCTRAHFGQGLPYHAVEEMEGLPYVCSRIPTGGGKTLVACHAVDAARRELLHAETVVALWLVPSNAIREQTLKALKNRSHPYRQALEAAAGPVTILDVENALYVTQATLDAHTTIIVSTMQAFRVEDTTGRRVYRSAGALKHHFDNATEAQLARLERTEEGLLRYSLANVLRLRRPVVIVDEAHGARTDLSFDTLARFAPSCILEFTATPHTGENPSNILHSVSAAELKAEEMIKLPIRLETRPDWKELLGDAIACRKRLEELATAEEAESGDYLRPVMLLQAQPRSKQKETLTVEVVKRCMMEDHRIPEGQIAIATGDANELDGVDILARDCPIRYVITVQALREGWDCPFAYVLCSVAEMRKTGAVEQILGRILRMPGAKRKRRNELNLAYAFAASANFAEAAQALQDSLVENGFERQEARDLIVATTPAMPDPELPGEFMGTYSAPMPEAPVKIAKLPEQTLEKLAFNTQANVLTFQGAMTELEREAIKECFKSEAGKACVDEVFRKSNGLPLTVFSSPSSRGEIFSIPVLAVQQGDFFEAFEETHFLEREWNLATCDPTLTEADYLGRRPEAKHAEIDISDKGRITARFIESLQGEMTEFQSDAGWTVVHLVRWLDLNIPHLDITPAQSNAFILAVINYLVDKRGLPLDFLVRDKYRLRNAIATSINRHRETAHAEAFQYYISLECETPLIVVNESVFTYDPTNYPASTQYKGSYRWQKHFYENVGDLKHGGEEYECAVYLDQMPEVEYWVRNIAIRPNHSFWLPTKTDRFYPDFTARLKDGRNLVVEYKGGDREDTADTREKKALGELWEARSEGVCLFVLCVNKDYDAIARRIRASN
jgi:type III restriction enzyme